MLLAIDTSAGTSVAVVDRGAVLAEHDVKDTRRHAEVIASLILTCLAESGCLAEELSGVAVGMGPGPFTGLRVGIAAANAFALGAGKPVRRVTSHDVLAFGRYEAGARGPLLVTTDARRRERYWSAYQGCDEFGLPIRAQGPGISRTDEVRQQVTDYAGYQRCDGGWVSAASAGLLAERLLAHGRELAEAAPLYLRSPDVTHTAVPKRVTP